jgi:hypothetical protein
VNTMTNLWKISQILSKIIFVFLSSREDIWRVVAFNGVLIYFGSHLPYLFSRLSIISGFFFLYWPPFLYILIENWHEDLSIKISRIVPTSDTTVINNMCVYTWIIYSRCLVIGELSSRMAVVQRTSWQFEFWWVTAV